jgi:hypothetical protein
MSYKEKRALISLVAVWVVGIGFVVGLWRHPPPTPVAVVPGVFVAFILLAGIILVSYLALAIGVGFKEARRPSDERDRLVQLASQRNAGWIGIIGLWTIPWFTLNPTPRAMTILVSLGLFLLSQIVLYGSELYYYRRGV